MEQADAAEHPARHRIKRGEQIQNEILELAGYVGHQRQGTAT
jgi:hypothetical protein